jgi:hypothetical protein
MYFDKYIDEYRKSIPFSYKIGMHYIIYKWDEIYIYIVFQVKDLFVCIITDNEKWGNRYKVSVWINDGVHF